MRGEGAVSSAVDIETTLLTELVAEAIITSDEELLLSGPAGVNVTSPAEVATEATSAGDEDAPVVLLISGAELIEVVPPAEVDVNISAGRLTKLENDEGELLNPSEPVVTTGEAETPAKLDIDGADNELVA